MIKDILWVFWYRLQCLKVTINNSFYQFITFKIALALDNIIRSVLWLLLILGLTPLELILGISVNIADYLNIAQKFSKITKKSMVLNGKNKEASMKEYEEYKQFLLDEENK